MAAAVQRAVSEILITQFADDPVVSQVSIVGADAGMQMIKLYYYSRIPNTEYRMAQITQMVRFELARRLDQKFIPQIKFVYDDTLEKSERIEEILKDLR